MILTVAAVATIGTTSRRACTNTRERRLIMIVTPRAAYFTTGLSLTPGRRRAISVRMRGVLLIFRTTPKFETSAPDLLWLTRAIFVGTGERYPSDVRIRFWRVE
jgi:hypothetical protein